MIEYSVVRAKVADLVEVSKSTDNPVLLLDEKGRSGQEKFVITFNNDFGEKIEITYADGDKTIKHNEGNTNNRYSIEAFVAWLDQQTAVEAARLVALGVYQTTWVKYSEPAEKKKGDSKKKIASSSTTPVGSRQGALALPAPLTPAEAVFSAWGEGLRKLLGQG